jgi:RNA polymerase sigma factor (sigma-70 family)
MSVPCDMSDAEALGRCRRDPGAICVIYDRHVARLVAALTHASGDSELAFDLAQETFARALERGHRVKVPPDGSAWPWLWTVGRNLLRDRQRRELVDASARRRLGIAMVPYDGQAIEELIAQVEFEGLTEPLASALSDLPSEQRDAVVGRVVAGLDYERLATTFNTSEQALRARVSRGLRTLRIRLSGGRP